MSTTFTHLVGCELPIQQAPVGFPAALPDLPLAVAAAGGHGMLAGVRMPAADLADRLQVLRAQTSAFGVNLIEPMMEGDALDVAAEHAPVVELYLGAPSADLVGRASAGGALVSWQVISAEEARAAEAAGCDMVVARGIEAGGRARGGVGLLPLLDEVLDAVEVPVIAAGGIASSRGVAAVLAAGAAAARVGTRFLAAEEAATHPVYLDALLRAAGSDAVLTEAYSAPPAPRSWPTSPPGSGPLPVEPGAVSNTAGVTDRNVLGGELEPCGTDPVTGFYRDGCCSTGPEDLGSHTICAVVTADFLEHQRSIGNDLVTPMPEYRFPGLEPGDRWCVTAANWLRAHEDGAAAYVVLASTHERTLDIVPLEALEQHAVDVPADPGALGD
jgi:uncharacterized protein (DUF2237 family)/thiamine monophosphate synthase